MSLVDKATPILIAEDHDPHSVFLVEKATPILIFEDHDPHSMSSVDKTTPILIAEDHVIMCFCGLLVIFFLLMNITEVLWRLLLQANVDFWEINIF